VGICPFCNSQVEDKYNFCTNCEKQIKCVFCSEALIPNKSKCFKCGKSPESDIPSTMNEFTLEEKQSRGSSSRSVKGKLSDSAITSVAALLSRTSLPIWSTKGIDKKRSDGQLPLLAELSDDTLEGKDIQHEEQKDTPRSDRDIKIQKYFEEDGNGSIIAKTIDFKGKNKKGQQINFMILFAGAYKSFFHKPVPTEQIFFDALKVKNMLDINVKTTYFKYVVTHYLMKVGNGYSLANPGETEIDRILIEMDDITKPGFTDWDKIGKSRGKPNHLTDEMDKKIKTWIDKDANTGTFDIRTLKGPTQYAMFSIYLLTKSLKVLQSVTTPIMYEYLVGKFSTIPHSKDAIRKSLTRQKNAGRFKKASDGGFYLTPNAETEVAGWLNGEPIKPSSDDGSQ
jgi:hypothetical protein